MRATRTLGWRLRRSAARWAATVLHCHAFDQYEIVTLAAGPILLFHSAQSASRIDPTAALDLNVVPTSDSDVAADFMSFKSHVNSRFPIDHMFPHFETLAHEGVASKRVKGADVDVLSVLESICDSTKVSAEQRSCGGTARRGAGGLRGAHRERKEEEARRRQSESKRMGKEEGAFGGSHQGR